jgi:alpha-beta hydrolase superfamily lysophospholipase
MIQPEAHAMPALEIISHHPRTPRQGSPRLLFVHGICVGAWVWEEYFLPYFAGAGFEVHALSLRGHGNSSGHERIATWRLADYTADLREAVRLIGDGPLAVVGHSLGGAVVQDWLRTGGRAAGAALLASVPPWGLAHSAWQMWLSAPDLFHQLARMSFFGTRAVNPQVMRKNLFSDDLPDADYARFVQRAQDESRYVGMELQGWRPFAPAPWQAPPMLVLGGENDRFVLPQGIRGTAAYYGVQAHIVPRLAHVLMLEPRWEEAAKPLLDWLLQLSNPAQQMRSA